jgi:hydrogenase assembly chaperone HypC/HupF
MSGRENQKAPRECDSLTSDGLCITCSDMAVPARVLRIDQESGFAIVAVKGATEEVDITLVDSVVAGDVVLVHGGVAMALLREASDE